MPDSIIIIGASSGLGEAVARIYIGRGCRVGVAARRVEKLQALHSQAPDRVMTAEIDICAADAPNRLKELIDRLGGVDTILLSAGVGFENPDLNPAKEEDIVATNCLGFTRIVDAAFRYFERAGRKGHIAAITSIAGTKGLGQAPAYSASKRFGSTYLTALDQLAHMKHLPISITDIRPGFADTALLDPAKHHPMMMAPEYAARRIVCAIDRNRRVAVIDWRWNIVVGLWRMIPSWLWVKLPITTSSKKL